MRHQTMTPSEIPHQFDQPNLRLPNNDENQQPYIESEKRTLELSESDLYGYPGKTYEEPINKEYVQMWRSLYSYDPK